MQREAECSDKPLTSTVHWGGGGGGGVDWGQTEVFRVRAQKLQNLLIRVPGLVTSLASWLKGPMAIET